MKRFLVLLLALFTLAGAAMAQAKEYLPGDFVHVIVEAPVDTAQMTATMPDASVISLVQERRTHVWRGVWEVPIGFKSGTYTAKLSAVDLGGNVFEGETDSFTVGQLSITTVVEKSKAPVNKPPLAEKIVSQPLPPAESKKIGQEIIKEIKKIIPVPEKTIAPDLEKEEKDKLINLNLESGRRLFNTKKYQQAAAYFRIVLYLDAKNKEAALYLQQARDLQKAEEAAGLRSYILMLAAALGVVVLLVIIGLYLRSLLRSQPAEKSDWLAEHGLKGNPFAAEALKNVVVVSDAVAAQAFSAFIRGRVEASGGKGLGPFTASALEKVFELAKGKPKEAVQICDWAIKQAIEQNAPEITAELVRSYEKSELKRILVADDEELVRIGLEAILKSGGGYQVDFAVDGEDALKKVKENFYSLVLLDIEMPKIDGYELLKQIREHNKHLPVIFVTGKGVPQKTVESMTKYNLTGYIEKPFKPEKVLDEVAKIMKQ